METIYILLAIVAGIAFNKIVEKCIWKPKRESNDQWLCDNYANHMGRDGVDN